MIWIRQTADAWTILWTRVNLCSWKVEILHIFICDRYVILSLISSYFLCVMFDFCFVEWTVSVTNSYLKKNTSAYSLQYSLISLVKIGLALETFPLIDLLLYHKPQYSGSISTTPLFSWFFSMMFQNTGLIPSYALIIILSIMAFKHLCLLV